MKKILKLAPGSSRTWKKRKKTTAAGSNGSTSPIKAAMRNTLRLFLCGGREQVLPRKQVEPGHVKYFV